MAVLGPAIPDAILKTAHGEEIAYLASDRWWRQIPVLREASQQNRLACRDCGERIVLVSEGVPAPFFKHWRDTKECIPPNGGGVSDRRRRSLLRHQIVVALRAVLPVGTPVDCDEYLAGRRPSVTINPDRPGCAVIEISVDPPEMAEWDRRQEAGAASGVPVYHLFADQRVPGRILGIQKQRWQLLRIQGALNADMIKAIRHSNVDMACALQFKCYDHTRVAESPGTLFYFLPGRSPYEGGSLILMRGILPHLGQTAWTGVAYRVPMVADEVRFSPRHGFYTPSDLAMMRRYREYFSRLRAKQRKVDPLGPATSHRHPLLSAWLRKVSGSEQQREQTGAKEPAAAAPVPVASPVIDMTVHEEYLRLMEVLYEEGNALLGGRTLPCKAELYTVDPSFWQAVLIGFLWRAGLRFELHRALTWLQDQEFITAANRPYVALDLPNFWRAAVELGVTRQSAYQWRYDSSRDRVQVPPALCIICSMTTAESERKLTAAWRLYDPVKRFCKCVKCWETVR